jgi:hypothetical protein
MASIFDSQARSGDLNPGTSTACRCEQAIPAMTAARAVGSCGYYERMGQSSPELPVDTPDTLVSAVDNARRGVVTHITIKGERVCAIVPQSTLAMSQLLAALLTSETAASALPEVLSAAFPWASSLPEDHLNTFAGELRGAVVAESPKQVETVLFDWHAVADVRAGKSST